MQQRRGIAQVLLSNPDLVILDELNVGFDPFGMVEVRELVKAIAKEDRTVLFSFHLLFEVEQVCSHVTIINHGEALVSDTLHNVLSFQDCHLARGSNRALQGNYYSSGEFALYC